MPSAAITGWGSALPDQVVTNADLEARLDTSDQWIRERSGIRERRVGGTTSGLAVDATQRALDRAGVAPSQVDLLVLSTNTPDQPVPATAALIQSKLGLAGGAVDLNSGCSGFVYGLVMANGLIATGLERVILTASDTVSRIVDPEDRSTAVLFGDAAGAVVLEAVPGPTLLGWDLGSDGAAAPFLYQERGKPLYMDGREVFRRAVRATTISARAALDRAKVDVDDIALFVPHQANLRIIEAVGERLGVPTERTKLIVERTGNTSSASIPVAIAEAADEGRLQEGDLVLMAGFGAGMTWGSAVFRWGQRAG